jgi:metal-sulfur cluster biosynthetic enzyme
MTEKTTITPEEIIERLIPVEDPELHMSIVDLGLVYGAKIDDDGMVEVTMTLTTPACPLGPMLIGQIQDTLMDAPGVKDVNVDITFSPPWNPSTMANDEIRMRLGMW